MKLAKRGLHKCLLVRGSMTVLELSEEKSTEKRRKSLLERRNNQEESFRQVVECKMVSERGVVEGQVVGEKLKDPENEGDNLENDLCS